MQGFRDRGEKGRLRAQVTFSRCRLGVTELGAKTVTPTPFLVKPMALSVARMLCSIAAEEQS